jgi:pyruvate formate lyase activating enzyme
MSKIGRIHSIETLGTVDGPGIRIVVFMQGCPLRCRYCHNPDTWDASKGKEYTVEELTREIFKYKSYMKFSGGGVTFTGGDPLLQADFLTEVAKRCKENDISIAIDTSGFLLNDSVKELFTYTDLVLLDIKSYDPTIYRKITGGRLDPTLRVLDYLKEKDIDAWVRFVLVPGLTDDMDSIKELSDYLDHYPNVEKIELLPFHKMGEYKWEELGIPYQLGETLAPDEKLLKEVQQILESNGKKVSVNT